VYAELLAPATRHEAKSWRFLASYRTWSLHHLNAVVPLRPHHNVLRDSRYAAHVRFRLLRLHDHNFSVPARLHIADMPPQIKQDLNRSGWETTDFPSVCEKCLPDNPYVQMLKEDHGAVSADYTLPTRKEVVAWKL
jgi:hypothetical protein